MAGERSSTDPTGKEGPVWSTLRWGEEAGIGKRIFCNRSLNMRSIVAVGFDMDYTLAQYMPETFESLAYGGTTRKLVNDLGYPKEILGWTFDWKYMVRGLVLDKKRGNILKMDRHKYVKVAHHGFKELSKEEKNATYGNKLIRDAFDEPEYALIDTLFSLAEAYLFAQLVDFRDNHPGKFSSDVDYGRMYRDVRAAVDLCHRDGTLKEMVAKSPKKYITEDFSIVPMFKMLRDSGRATFLVTNSLWDYTNVVMNFLCGYYNPGKELSYSYDWLKNFDVVITGRCSMLVTTFMEIFLRSKKALGWRTMLVVPELEKEVQLLWETRDTRKELQKLRRDRDDIEDKIHHINWSFKFEVLHDDKKQKILSELNTLELQREHVCRCHQEAQRDCHQKFHPVWGQLMKTGYQNSCFAHQVERFACLYTSQVTNLALYSPDKYYRPSEDFMPHEFDILAS